ncbi:hypothetical protein FRC19_002194 [Serendipita sp. 401]|nr:hypothetical protein FRC19_002194 [Serendipita sp. 401]
MEKVNEKPFDRIPEGIEEPSDSNAPFMSKWQFAPADLLSTIFEFCVAEERETNPRVFMGVCSHWRWICLHTRSLWSKIVLAHPAYEPERVRWFEFEVCHTPAELQAAIERTSGGTIELHWIFGECRWEAPDGGDAETTPQKMIDVLRTSKAFLQIRRLRVESGLVDLIEDINFEGFEFPALEHASLDMSSSSLNKCMQETAYQLRYLWIGEIGSSRGDWDLSKMQLPLELMLYTGSEAVQQHPYIRPMICSARHLFHLSLWDLIVRGDEAIFLPTLETLHLNNARFECNIACPNLRNLDIYKSFIKASEINPLILPSLMVLGLGAMKAVDFVHIHAPSVKSIEFKAFPHGDSDFIEVFLEKTIKAGHIRPQAIDFQYFRDSSPQLQILRQISDIRELHFRGSILEKRLFEELAGCSLPAGPESHRRLPVCPSLQIFRLDIPGSFRHSQIAIDMSDWFRAVVRERSQRGYALKEAFIRDRHGDDDPWTKVV